METRTQPFTREDAITLAGEIHVNQRWDDDTSYLDGHLIPVMHLATRLAEIDGAADVEITAIAALFHDAIEDVLLKLCGSLDAAVEWLRVRGVPERALDVVVVVTMLPGETRVGYMTRVAASNLPEVRPLKTGDNLFNSDPKSLAKLALTQPQRAERLDGKYRRDRAILAQANQVLGRP